MAKIRHGYVSNSSSSSFMVVGRIISNPSKAIKDGKLVMVYIKNGGSSGECEDWSMFLNKRIYDILNKSKWFNTKNPIYIDVDKCAVYQYEDNFNEKDSLIVFDDVTGNVFAFYRDYSSPNDENQLIKFLEEVE